MKITYFNEASKTEASIKVSKIYDSYKAMKKDAENLKEGDTVGILSYYKGLEKGASAYQVTIHKCGRKYIELLPFEVKGKKIVSVEMFGAYGDGIKADDAAINKAFAYKNADIVEFESEKYLQTKGLELTRSNVTINGCDSTIYNKYDYMYDENGNVMKKLEKSGFYSFPSTVNADFRVCGKKGKMLKNITIHNFNMVCSEMRGAGSLVNRTREGIHGQIQISFIDGFHLYDSSFIVPERTMLGEGFLDGTGREEKKGELIYCNTDCIRLNNDLRNVVVENNKFVDFGLGVQGITFDVAWGVMKNFVIRNNWMEKRSHDETFTIYGCELFDGGDIYGNTIYSHDEPLGNASKHVIGFGAAEISSTVKNIKFHNNNIDIVTNFDAIMFGTCENIKIYENKFDIKPNSKDEPIVYGAFRVPEPHKTTQKNIKIYKNDITLTNSEEKPMNFNCGDGFKFEDNKYKYVKG